MNVITSAVAWARNIAADNSHGYDQTNRWGADYDCSSFVISAFKSAGLSLSSTYTGNMYSDFLAHGFIDATSAVNLANGSGLEIGDVLLNHANHTALYIGGGLLVQASINELGKTTGGQSGDQTGREICERSYYNYPWNCVLRYKGSSAGSEDSNAGSASASLYWPPRELAYYGGTMITGADVLAAQALLKCRGYELDTDGEYGRDSRLKIMAFQAEHGLDADGICGSNTWGALLER